MAFEHIHGIDLNLDLNKLFNVVLHPTGSAPSGELSVQGQILYVTGAEVPKYYTPHGSSWYNMSSRWTHTHGGVLINETLILSTGASLLFHNNAIIDANYFYGSPILEVDHGGTSVSTFINNAVLIGDGNSIVHNTNLLSFDLVNQKLGIMQAAPSAVLHIGTGLVNSPPLYIFPRPLISIPFDNHFEYDGSGFYYTTSFGSRRTLAAISDNLANTFVGILPISKGGTNASSFTSRGIIIASGSTLISLEGTQSGQVPRWDGSKWVNSTSGVLRIDPNSSSNNQIISQSSGIVPLGIQGSSGQFGDMCHLTNYSGGTLVAVGSGGNVVVRGNATVTGALNVRGQNNFYSNAIFAYTSGAIYVAGSAAGFTSIGALTMASMGINFDITKARIELKDNANIVRSDISNNSGFNILGGKWHIVSTSGHFIHGTENTYLSVGAGKGNAVTLPSGNGSLALITDIALTGLYSTGVVVTVGPRTSGNVPVWNGSQWIPTGVVGVGGSGGVSDHGLLTGLGDDDHAQYIFNAPTDNSRNIITTTTGDVKALSTRVGPAELQFLVIPSGGYVRFAEDPTLGNTGYIQFRSTIFGTPNNTIFYTLPDAYPGGLQRFLTSTTTGVMSWSIIHHHDLSSLDWDDHPQYVMTTPYTSGRNTIYPSGSTGDGLSIIYTSGVTAKALTVYPSGGYPTGYVFKVSNTGVFAHEYIVDNNTNLSSIRTMATLPRLFTLPNTDGTGIVGSNSSTTVTHAAFSDGTANRIQLRAITTGDLPTSLVNKYAYDLTVGTGFYAITHNLDTRDVMVYVYENSGTFNQVLPTVSHFTSGITIGFGFTTTMNYRVLIHG